MTKFLDKVFSMQLKSKLKMIHQPPMISQKIDVQLAKRNF